MEIVSPTLSSWQRSVFIRIMEACPVEPEATFKRFIFQDSGRESLIAAADFKSDPAVHLVFTLGGLSRNKIFVTATDGDVSQLSNILAELEEYDSAESKLLLGHTFRSPNRYLQDKGYVASVMLKVDTLPALSVLKNINFINDEPICFNLVVFISQNELDCKVANGFDALLDLFERECKDIISI